MENHFVVIKFTAVRLTPTFSNAHFAIIAVIEKLNSHYVLKYSGKFISIMGLWALRFQIPDLLSGLSIRFVISRPMSCIIEFTRIGGSIYLSKRKRDLAYHCKPQFGRLGFYQWTNSFFLCRTHIFALMTLWNQDDLHNFHTIQRPLLLV